MELKLRTDEEFVSRALVAFFSGHSFVSASDGEDPPDLYLTFDVSRVGVEVTRLSQFTFEPDGTLGNRATQDSFGMKLIEDLNTTVGVSLPSNISLLVGVEMPVPNAAKFKKNLATWVSQIAVAPVLGERHETTIQDSRATISVVPGRSTGKKIIGFVANNNSSTDILTNARLVLEERIRTKSDLCAAIAKPVWLALLNDYWLADADTYALAARQIATVHCFERIFLVFANATVTEIFVGTLPIPPSAAR